MSGGFSVISVGARCPMGLDAVQTTMVWRSGRLTPQALPWKDKRNQAIGSVRTRALSDEVLGFDRLVELAVPALREAVLGAGERLHAPPALVIATAERRPGLDAASRGLAEVIAARAKLEIDAQRSEVIAVGHAGFAVALQRAVSLLQAAPRAAVIVGGVDTYHHPETLAWLDSECRLHAHEAPNGIVPSEGAAFLVLTSGSGPALAELTGLSCALEEGSPEGPEPDLGLALQEVVVRAAANKELPIGWALTDCNGERHRSRRWSFVKVREPDIIANDTLELDAGDELGDAGAAVGALLAVRVVMSFASGAEREMGSALIALSSESQERGAFVIEVAE